MSIKVVKYTYDEFGRQSWSFQDVPEDAPSDTKEYVRKDGAWAEKTNTFTLAKLDVETVLTGEITTHTHPGGSGGLSQQQIEGLI